ncbi:aspartate/glutamate racemase family protein [Oscillibacter sp. MSJ-2]|uniref:Aspartate/glutamate racemase family protein n=2 Tax=Dysosmobacter acutus TaxID=2841504 RepID=A0ABS6FA53_9FIRM|nr:aspartate/glutamate racemase family protein [Dysosmobacter acutus]
MHGALIEQYYPMVHTTSYCIEDQPSGIHSPETKALAIPKIIKLAKEHRDAAAIVISCCDDPAVRELREELSIPVFGAGQSVCAVAQTYGTKIGILGITEYAPGPYHELLGNRLINLGRPKHVTCTLDLMTEAGRKGVIEKAQELKNHGADVIALACTGMSTIKIAGAIEEQCGLPVIDPVMAEGLFACYACLRSEK